jgi:hypothetical protein
MPELRLYQVFISHAWTYDEYHIIKDWLNATPNFRWRDFSVPYDYPLDVKSKSELEKSLKRLIRRAQIVLILAGMEASRRPWIKFEIDFAIELEKPIVGIIPRGARRISRVIDDAAKDFVGWNRASIIKAIRRNAM